MKLFIFLCCTVLSFTSSSSAQTSASFQIAIDVFDNGGLGYALPSSSNYSATSVLGQSAGSSSLNSNFIVNSGAGCIFCGLTIPTGILEKNEAARIFLGQNYPNPVSVNDLTHGTTSIRYSIEHPAIIELSLYNIFGEKVKTIVQNRVDAGLHVVQINVQSLPPGMYIYQLRTDGVILVGKLMVID